MASAIVVNLDHIETRNAAVEGDANFGDNGPANGPDPEYTVYTSLNSDSARTEYNPDYAEDGSWDSGWIPVDFEMAPDGLGNEVITWTVNHGSATTVTLAGTNPITGVDILAGTNIFGSVAWSNLSITFSNGSTTDVYAGSGATNPSVDTTSSATASAEQVVRVTPSGTTNTSLSVTGSIRFTTPSGATPLPDDLLAGVAVYI